MDKRFIYPLIPGFTYLLYKYISRPPPSPPPTQPKLKHVIGLNTLSLDYLLY